MKKLVGALVLVIASSSAGWANKFPTYEEMSVANGESISRTVTLAGTIPKPKGYNFTTLPDQIYLDPVMHDIQASEKSQVGPRVLFHLPPPISPRYPNEAAHSAHYH